MLVMLSPLATCRILGKPALLSAAVLLALVSACSGSAHGLGTYNSNPGPQLFVGDTSSQRGRHLHAQASPGSSLVEDRDDSLTWQHQRRRLTDTLFNGATPDTPATTRVRGEEVADPEDAPPAPSSPLAPEPPTPPTPTADPTPPDAPEPPAPPDEPTRSRSVDEPTEPPPPEPPAPSPPQLPPPRTPRASQEEELEPPPQLASSPPPPPPTPTAQSDNGASDAELSPSASPRNARPRDIQPSRSATRAPDFPEQPAADIEAERSPAARGAGNARGRQNASPLDSVVEPPASPERPSPRNSQRQSTAEPSSPEAPSRRRGQPNASPANARTSPRRRGASDDSPESIPDPSPAPTSQTRNPNSPSGPTSPRAGLAPQSAPRRGRRSPEVSPSPEPRSRPRQRQRQEPPPAPASAPPRSQRQRRQPATAPAQAPPRRQQAADRGSRGFGGSAGRGNGSDRRDNDRDNDNSDDTDDDSNGNNDGNRGGNNNDRSNNDGNSGSNVDYEEIAQDDGNSFYDPTLKDENGSPVSFQQQRKAFMDQQADAERSRKIAIIATVTTFSALIMCTILGAILVARKRARRNREFEGSPAAYANQGAAWWETSTEPPTSGKHSYPYSFLSNGTSAGNGKLSGGNGGNSHNSDAHITNGLAAAGNVASGRAHRKPPTIYDHSGNTGLQRQEATRGFFERAPLRVAGSGSTNSSGVLARGTSDTGSQMPHTASKVSELPLGAPPPHMRERGGASAMRPRYNAVSKAMSVMSGLTGGMTGGASAGVESPYQPVNSAALDGSDTVVQGNSTMDTRVDPNDGVAVLHAQLDHYEKYKGGVVLDKYRLSSQRRVVDAHKMAVNAVHTATRRACVLHIFHSQAAYDAERAVYNNSALATAVPRVVDTVPEDARRHEPLPHAASATTFPPTLVTDRCISLNGVARASGHPKFATALQIMIQVTEKVNVLHDAGFAHLDLQPQHLLWCQADKAWCLSSFTRTRAFGERAQRGLMFLAYAAPEVAQSWKDGATGFPADPATDVWALGVIFYELLSKQRYFAMAQDERQVAAMLLGDEQLPHLRADAEPRNASLGVLRESLLQMLSLSPDNRPTLDEVLDKWAPIAQTAGVGNTGTSSVSMSR